MSRRKIIFFVMVTFVVSVDQATLAEVQTSQASIVPETTLAQWGYQTVTNFAGTQLDWQIARFGEATLRNQRIKAVAEVPGWPQAFYRFTITEETYPTLQLAVKRVGGLHDIPSSVSTKMNPSLLLCRAFALSNKVLIVSTDVSMFGREELPRIYRLLEKSCDEFRPEGPQVESPGQRPGLGREKK